MIKHILNSMSISRRHHYIPQFLIRHFTDEKGFLHVYDKETGEIAQRSPKAAFFEWNRNTFKIGEKEVDNLEKVYSELDQEFAANLAEVLSDSKHDSGSLTNLLLLATTLKWRTPSSDEEFSRLKQDTVLADLGVQIKPKGPAQESDPENIQRIVNSELFKEGKRLILPVQPFLKADKSIDEDKLITLHDNSYIHRCPDARYPALLGDCGIIEQGNVAYDQIADFIFPLSSTKTLICKKNPHLHIRDLARFYSCRDLTTLFSAKRYVGCANKEHLQALVSNYHLMKSQPSMEEYLLKALFEIV